MKKNKCYGGITVLLLFFLGPIWAQEGNVAAQSSSNFEQKDVQPISTIIYEGRTYNRSIEGYITLVEENDPAENKTQPISTIIYEGRTYNRSIEGYITLVEENMEDKKSNIEGFGASAIDKSSYSFDLYPNPAKNELNVRYVRSKIRGETGELSIWSIDGKQMIHQKVASSNSKNNITLDISSLNDGIYIVKYISSSGLQTSRFLKQ